MRGFSRLPIFDVRLLGAIAAAMIALARLWNPSPGPKFVRSQLARGELGVQVTSLASSPTARQVATTNTAGRVALRSQEGGWRIDRYLDFPGFASAVAFSVDGQLLAAAGKPSGICVWDLESSQNTPAKVIMAPIQRATRLLFSPDGKSLAVTTDLDGTILLWDLAAQREHMVLHQPSPVTSIAFSPDGRWLATGGGRFDQSVFLWDLSTGKPRALLEHGRGPAVALAFSPDGATLASANFPEHHVRLWDIETGRVRRAFAEHTHSMNSVAFSPDGTLLATAGNDGMIGLWTVATGQQRARLDGQATCLRTVAFSSEGRTLVLATAPGPVKILPAGLPQAGLVARCSETPDLELTADRVWPDLMLVKAVEVDGIVVDETGQPVVGADVYAIDEGPLRQDVVTKTGPGGSFHLHQLDQHSCDGVDRPAAGSGVVGSAGPPARQSRPPAHCRGNGRDRRSGNAGLPDEQSRPSYAVIPSEARRPVRLARS
jgi:dipeptidyl aminopeptidase/acylaminoacyl peptidase